MIIVYIFYVFYTILKHQSRIYNSSAGNRPRLMMVLYKLRLHLK